MTRLSKLAIVLVGAAIASPPAMAGNLLINPGFENVDAGGNFVGWTTTGGNIAPDTVFPNLDATDAFFGDPPGTFPPSTLNQPVATSPGAEYTLAFALLDEAGFSGDTFAIQYGGFTATITGDQAAAPGTLPSFYTEFTFDIPGLDITDPATTLSFNGQSIAGWNLDDVSLTEVPAIVTTPEPGALALFAIAVPVLVCLRRKGAFKIPECR